MKSYINLDIAGNVERSQLRSVAKLTATFTKECYAFKKSASIDKFYFIFWLKFCSTIKCWCFVTNRNIATSSIQNFCNIESMSMVYELMSDPSQINLLFKRITHKSTILQYTYYLREPFYNYVCTPQFRGCYRIICSKCQRSLQSNGRRRNIFFQTYLQKNWTCICTNQGSNGEICAYLFHVLNIIWA